MLSFAAPAWLLGWLLAPVIRWLHRSGRPRTAVPVARAALWRAAPVAAAADGARQPPDPAWRRRAALAAVLALALAGPQWPQGPSKLTLWLDDSPSMLTREVKGVRGSLALAQARELLAAQPWAEVELRRLSDPWSARGVDEPVRFSGAEVAPPPAALLRPDRVHWLLTDGAHPAALAWPEGRAPAKVLQVGQVARNVGIERLAARRHEGDPTRLDLLVTLRNGGQAAETRELTVVMSGQAPRAQTVTLAPGEAATRVIGLRPGPAATVTLAPADALAEDDSATLVLDAFAPLPVQVDPACPPPLRAAAQAHPALVATAGPARLHLVCGDGPAAGPGLRWVADRLPMPAEGTLQWPAGLAPSRRPALDPSRLRVTASLGPRVGDTVLLAAGGQALLLLRGGLPPRAEVALDAAALGPDLPLLLDFAAEQVLGRALLDPVAVLDRGATAAQVVPAAAGAASAPAAGPAPTIRPLVKPLLGLAALLLLWELAALLRRGHALWRHERAGSLPSAHAGSAQRQGSSNQREGGVR